MSAPEPAAISPGSRRCAGRDAPPADDGSSFVALGGRYGISPGRTHPAPNAPVTEHGSFAGLGSFLLRDRAESYSTGYLGAYLIRSAAWRGDATFRSIEGAGSSSRPITGKFKVGIMLRAAMNFGSMRSPVQATRCSGVSFTPKAVAPRYPATTGGTVRPGRPGRSTGA